MKKSVKIAIISFVSIIFIGSIIGGSYTLNQFVKFNETKNYWQNYKLSDICVFDFGWRVRNVSGWHFTYQIIIEPTEYFTSTSEIYLFTWGGGFFWYNENYSLDYNYMSIYLKDSFKNLITYKIKQINIIFNMLGYLKKIELLKTRVEDNSFRFERTYYAWLNAFEYYGDGYYYPFMFRFNTTLPIHQFTLIVEHWE